MTQTAIIIQRRNSGRVIEKEGGRVLDEPMEIPGYGLLISFIDTENNRVSLMQPFMESM